jgi:predicted adenine nucleotide alpha hydrolase (AANH) superfamily ATPase
MRVLIHACCAPCLIGPLDALRGEGHEPAALFYNPNIHPFLEFRKRVKAMRVFMEADAIPVEIDETYGLDFYVREIYDPLPRVRCARCYRARLVRTARLAAERGFDAFTTTLLGSPHQDHEALRRVGEEAAEAAKMPFLYRDFRSAHDEGHRVARARHLYLQQYCGCCFSEYERYRDTTRELYRGPGPKG